MRIRQTTVAGALALLLLAPACGGGGTPVASSAPTPPVNTAPGPPPTGCDPSSQQTLVAIGLKFDRKCIAVPAHHDTFLTFTNNDPGQSHNVAIYSRGSCFVLAASKGDASKCTKPEEGLRYKGSVLTGGQTTYHILGQRVGKYVFICTVHPSMHGVFNVT
jgi:plastocyanin